MKRTYGLVRLATILEVSRRARYGQDGLVRVGRDERAGVSSCAVFEGVEDCQDGLSTA